LLLRKNVVGRKNLTEGKLNPELMQLNQKQLNEHVSRNEIRSKRREILESILANRENYVSRSAQGSFRVSKALILLATTVIAAGGCLIYYLKYI
jgi:hypothetical protein